jgi:hypothetical protein
MRNLASHAQQLEIQKVQVKSSHESSNSNEHISTKTQIWNWKSEVKLNVKSKKLKWSSMWNLQSWNSISNVKCWKSKLHEKNNYNVVYNVCYYNMNCLQIKNWVDCNGAVLKMIEYMPRWCVCIQHLKQLSPMNSFGSSVTNNLEVVQHHHVPYLVWRLGQWHSPKDHQQNQKPLIPLNQDHHQQQ